MSWPLWFLLFAFLARILGRDWLAGGVASLVNLVRELFSVLCHMWEIFLYLVVAYLEALQQSYTLAWTLLMNGLEAVVNKYPFSPIAPVDSVTQRPEIPDPFRNEDKKREKSEHGTERRQKELIERQKELIERQKKLIELRIPLQPSDVRSRTPIEETSRVIHNNQNDYQPEVRLPIYSQIEAGVPTADGEIDAPSIVADKDGNPVANPDQRNSDSVDSDLEVGEHDEKLEESNDNDSGEADLLYHHESLIEVAGKEEQNSMVPNDELVTTSTSLPSKILHSGNGTPIIVHSSATWRPPGRC
ncbi:MAG: hypothetical protein LQ349_004991 [Xanthoria aureola]|nr:MAG: hypothetical protein LQ349_004991 [Xanthoria aureola]